MKSEMEVPKGWEVKKLENISNKITDGFHNIPPLEKTGIPLLDSTYIDDSYNIKINEAKKFISVETDKKSYARCKPKQNDILISSRGSIGKLAIVKKGQDFNIMANIALVRPTDKLLPIYLLYYMSSKITEKQLGIQSYGSSQKALYLKNIKNIKIIFPQNLNEQQKIADILSKVDGQIELTEKIITKTEELKKGLMQKFLTKGIGHTKFKKTELGEIPEGWEIKKIIDCCHVNKKSISNSINENYKINYIDITSIDYPGQNPNRKQILFKNAPSRARRRVYDNNILVSTVRPYLRSFTFIEKAEENLICSTGFGVLESKENNHPRFIYQYILSDMFLEQVSKKLVGSNYPAINNDDLKNIKIVIPSEYQEQKQIASILSKVDEQIQDNKKELNHLKELKKGLMQDLLTGKVRVSV